MASSTITKERESEKNHLETASGSEQREALLMKTTSNVTEK